MDTVRARRSRLGRPPLPPGRHYNVRLPIAVAEKIQDFSDQTGLTYTDIISKLVVDHLDEITPENYGVETGQPSFDQLEAIYKVG